MGRAVALLFLILGCEHESSAPTVLAPSAAPPACSAGIYGIEAYDALYEFEIAGRPALYVTSTDAIVENAGPLLEQIERALAADPSSLVPPARIVLQNDVWGLAQRVPASGELAPLARALASLVRRLALPAALFHAEIGVPGAALQALAPSAGWREVGTEMPVLGHERAFGLRRIFHVLERENARALVSQLVGLDTDGRAHATEVVGDLEILFHTDTEPVAGARLFELDRRAVRCFGADRGLHETDRVSFVPGLGASSFFLELDPPEPIASLPCARCHDGEVDSLPSAAIEPEPRLRSLVRQAGAHAAPIFAQEPN